MSHHSSWIKVSVTPSGLRETARVLGDAILQDKDELGIQAIAVRGMSGAIVGGAISAYCNIPLAIVRKPEVNSHSCYSVEYDAEFERYAIVDDFINSGDTVNAIHDSLEKKQLVKIYLYHTSYCGIESWVKGSYPYLDGVPIFGRFIG